MGFYFRIVKVIRRRKRRRGSVKTNKKEFLLYKEKARALAIERIRHFNSSYRYRINKVFIKNQKTRWGSCSKKGNLNFNYKIALLPPHMADYVIVHELCHLGELNHSKRFWALVAQTIPNYAKIRLEFKKYRII